jgi:uncharacterized protein YgbK (DUF1537 family)
MADVLFIGDDFTGASDSLSTYARFGWNASLLIDTDLASSGANAFDAPGIPTDLRSLRPDDARREIGRLWSMIEKLDPRIIHYKVCSTFDSGPEIGSIGANLSELAGRFDPDVFAVIGGQPSLGRYCAFGNLFAAAMDGNIHRIDRHPVMSAHPVTPMREGNLITHLEAQGLHGVRSAFLPELPDSEALVAKLRKGPVLFDAVSNADLRHVARALEGAGGRQLLVGASSVAEILADASPKDISRAAVTLPASEKLFVFAGSRSSSTQMQIEAATGYRIVELSADALRGGSGLAETAKLLGAGHAVLAHLGPGVNYGIGPSSLADLSVGFVSELINQVDIGYLGLAGGDTSSRICRGLGFTALDYWHTIGSGVCVCTARHESSERKNMRVMLKGGQMGEIDIFDRFAAFRTTGGES